jgi:hypothetical protein
MMNTENGPWCPPVEEGDRWAVKPTGSNPDLYRVVYVTDPQWVAYDNTELSTAMYLRAVLNYFEVRAVSPRTLFRRGRFFGFRRQKPTEFEICMNLNPKELAGFVAARHADEVLQQANKKWDTDLLDLGSMLLDISRQLSPGPFARENHEH